MPTLSAHDRTLSYQDSPGSGTPVVLVHSGGMSSRQWARLAARLADRHRVIAPDLLGIGQSSQVPFDAAFDWHEDADMLAALLETLPRDAGYHLVGHSYGGLVAIECARRAPERVRSIALYEPVAFGVLYSAGDTDGIKDLELYDGDGSMRDPRTGGDDAWMERFIDYWNGKGAYRALPEASRAAFLKVGRKVYQEVHSLTNDRTPHEAYRALTMPALLMAGARSTRAAHGVCEVLARTLPRATLERLEEAGHMGPLTHAQWVNERVDALIAAAERERA